MKNNLIKTEMIVKNNIVSVIRISGSNYLSLTDLARYANPEEPKIPIQTWMRNKNVISFLGLWEQIHNPNFKGIEFEAFENELEKNSVCSIWEHTAEDGKKYQTELYNLDAIISVGYRVNSKRATQFRRWATQVLKTFTIQGYVLDKERMKNGSFIDKDYFEKLLEDSIKIEDKE